MPFALSLSPLRAIAKKLSHPAAIHGECTVAVAQQRLLEVLLVLPDHNVLRHLPFKILDQSGADALLSARSGGVLHAVGEAHVRIILIDWRRGVHHERIGNARHTYGLKTRAPVGGVDSAVDVSPRRTHLHP